MSLVIKRVSFEGVNPQGRVDILVSRLIKRGVEAKAPQLLQAHEALSPLIDSVLHSVLGPRVLKNPLLPKTSPRKKPATVRRRAGK